MLLLILWSGKMIYIENAEMEYCSLVALCVLALLVFALVVLMAITDFARFNRRPNAEAWELEKVLEDLKCLIKKS